MTALLAAWPIQLGIGAGMMILTGAIVAALLIRGAREHNPICDYCNGDRHLSCMCIADCGRGGCHGPWNTVQLTALRDEDGSHG